VTKALWCLKCWTIKTFNSDASLTSCDCGRIKGWWVDPERGTARLWDGGYPSQRQYGRIIGLHNGFLAKAATSVTHEQHRQARDDALHAPGYLFDESLRGCPMVIIAPGESTDTRWATLEEWVNKTRQPWPPQPVAPEQLPESPERDPLAPDELPLEPVSATLSPSLDHA
jgi:hypothetical protein